MATTLIIAEAVARARTYYLELLDEYLLTLKGGGNCGDGHYAKLMCLKKLIRALDWDLTAGINDETTTAIYERLILEMVGYDNTIVLSTDPNVIIPTITIIAGVAGKDGKDGKDGRTIRIIQQDDPPTTIDGTPGGAPIQDGEVLWYCTLSDSPRGGRTFQRYDGQWIETGTAFIHKVAANEGNTNEYVLPVATASVLGGVKQGANITIAPDGTISTEAGTIGADGLSAYQVAVNNGFIGTEAEWLISIKGADGLPGAPGADSTVPGPAGEPGTTGAPGANGVGVPAGGTAKQRLVKVDGTDYNTTWETPVEAIQFAVSDETTNLSAGTAKVSFRMPYAFTLTSVRASLNDAATGSTFIVNIKENGVTIFSTNLSIDAGELTSVTAAIPAVISDASLADDALITVDIVQVGGTTAGKGLKISFIGTKS